MAIKQEEIIVQRITRFKQKGYMAINVCWHCSSPHGPLVRVRDSKKKKKTEDYICDKCYALNFYEPPIGNASKRRFE